MSDEGWTVTNYGNYSWSDRGGNPGGFILCEDLDTENLWYYVSPESWSGNWTPYIGKNFSFDLKHIDNDDGINLRFDDILIISGLNNSSISWPGSLVPWPGEPKNSWTHYEISLVPSSFGLNESRFSEFVRSVDQILIRGKYDNTRNFAGLDNVMIKNITYPDKKELKSEKKSNSRTEIDEFYRKRDNIISGSSQNDGSGSGKSISEIVGKAIKLYCEDTGWGTHWASGNVFDEFTYNNQDHYNRVILKSKIKGAMALVALPVRSQADVGGLLGDIFKVVVPTDGDANLDVYLVLEDKTDGIIVGERLIYSKSSGEATYFDEVIDEETTGYIDALLLKNHVYQVKLKASASSSAEGISSVIVDFKGGQGEYLGIFWEYDEVKWIS